MKKNSIPVTDSQLSATAAFQERLAEAFAKLGREADAEAASRDAAANRRALQLRLTPAGTSR